MILGDNPVTYKLFPGFSTSLEKLLDRLLDSDLDLDRDLETDLPYLLYGEGDLEYLDLLEYDIVNNKEDPIDLCSSLYREEDAQCFRLLSLSLSSTTQNQDLIQTQKPDIDFLEWVTLITYTHQQKWSLHTV